MKERRGAPLLGSAKSIYYRNLIKTPEYSHLTDFVPRLLDNNKGKHSCANFMKQNYVSS